MKRLNLLILSIFLGAMIAFMGCQKDDEPNEEEKNDSILPNSFSVDVPSSISASTTKSGTLKSTASDDTTLSGNKIYSHLRTFIHTGESAAEIVGGIIQAISEYNINKAITLSYESNDDGRTKNLEVVEDVTFDGQTWEFQMTISDAASTGGTYGGKGLQVFWNRNPIEGIAIINPYNIDRSSIENWFTDSTLCRIDYSEAATGEYEKHMIVYITEVFLGDPAERFAMETLKMFVGKYGSRVDVYGSSNHPNASFFTSTTGFNWAFTAAGYDDANIGVAEVGLPPSTLDETSRSVILEDYSIKKVFSDQINEEYPGIDSTVLNAYLHNTEAPGYFDSDGFIRGGTSPGNDYNALETAIQSLTPYNPKNISELTINFK